MPAVVIVLVRPLSIKVTHACFIAIFSPLPFCSLIVLYRTECFLFFFSYTFPLCISIGVSMSTGFIVVERRILLMSLQNPLIFDSSKIIYSQKWWYFPKLLILHVFVNMICPSFSLATRVSFLLIFFLFFVFTLDLYPSNDWFYYIFVFVYLFFHFYAIYFPTHFFISSADERVTLKIELGFPGSPRRVRQWLDHSVYWH